MLAMRSELMQTIHFDESFVGFHGYDFDITLQSTVAGFTNYVVYDISLEHLSKGKPDKNYYKSLIKAYHKWEKHLPIFGRNIPDDLKLKLLVIEKKRLRMLINRMIKTGFTTREILLELNYYIQLIQHKETNYLLTYIHFNIFFTRLFTLPRYFLNCRNQNLQN
jgi:hypothetical protein